MDSERGVVGLRADLRTALEAHLFSVNTEDGEHCDIDGGDCHLEDLSAVLDDLVTAAKKNGAAD